MPAPNPGGPNLTRRIIDVGIAGEPTSIFATGPTRAWRIRESILTAADAAATAEGFIVQIPNDNSAAGFTTKFGRPAYSTANDPGNFPEFENWNRISEFGPHGEVFGSGEQKSPAPGQTGLGAPGSGIGYQPPTLLAKVSSLTATGTSIEIVEYF